MMKQFTNYFHQVLGIAFAFVAARIFRKTRSVVAIQLYETFDSSTAKRGDMLKAGENEEVI